MYRLILCVVLSMFFVEVVNAKVWTSKKGTTVEATYKSCKNGIVRLKRVDGTDLKIKKTSLIEKDQLIIQQLMEEEASMPSIPEGEAVPEGAIMNDINNETSAIVILGIIIISFGGLLYVFTWFLGVYIAFKVHPAWGLSLLLFPGITTAIFSMQHWEESRQPFLAQVLSIFMIFGGIAVIILGLRP